MPGPYPLPTLAPTISATGISTVAYSDVLASLTASAEGIFGDDVYLEPDSQDGQLLAVFSKAVFDLGQALSGVFVSFSPTFAQGAQLSSLVKINGISRQVASNSEQNYALVGTVGTLIVEGSVRDANGQLWNLPDSVIVPAGGTITVTATAQEAGNLTAVGPITIATPTLGWVSATISGATVVGAPVETDPQLRRRQAASTGNPAQTPLEAISGTIANVPGVQQYQVYNNDTDATNVDGIPPFSISAVVLGGTVQNVATAIWSKKAPGTGTYGTTSYTVVDQYGVPDVINFYELAQVELSLLVELNPLTGYVSTTGTAIQEALAQYASSLVIGADSYWGSLFAAARLSGDAATTATGFTQAQLDVLSATYSLTWPGIYQARPNMVVTGGPFNAGATTIDVTNAANYNTGSPISITLDNGTQLAAVVTGVVGTAVSFLPAITAGRSAQNGALVYVAGDVGIAFNEGALLIAADVTVNVL